MNIANDNSGGVNNVNNFTADKDSFPRRNITNKLKNATNLTVKKINNKQRGGIQSQNVT